MTNNKKYTLIKKENKIVNGRIVYRIKSLKEFEITKFVKKTRITETIKVEQKGGWIQRERNLSHDGKCWVADNACVIDNATVMFDAVACGDTLMMNNASLIGTSTASGSSIMDGNAIFGGKIISGCSSARSNTSVLGNVKIVGKSTIDGDTCLTSTGRNIVINGDIILENINLKVFDKHDKPALLVTKESDLLSVDNVGPNKLPLTMFRG